MMADILKPDAVTLPQFSVFIFNSYTQLAEAEYLGYEDREYYFWLLLCDTALHDSIINSYNWSFSIAD